MRYLLDSTAIIDFGNRYGPGRDAVRRLFTETGDLFTCAIVVAESVSGGTDEELRSISGLLEALEFVALDPETARWAGEQRRAILRSGARKPAIPDALIAAAARRLGATIVTRNARDFQGFGVPVIDYDPRLP